MSRIDIFDVRMAVKAGQLKVEVNSNGLILLEDVATGEVVNIGKVPDMEAREAADNGKAE